jgi:nucleoside-diphosphate-sugar epimerase
MGHFLVTGAAGFIGSNVAEMLLDGGHYVTGIDNMNDAYDVRLKEWRLHRLRHYDCFSYRSLDISDREALRDVVGEFDAVINLAARAGVRKSVEDPYVYCDTNMGGTLNLLELCRERRVDKFILASTSSLYGLLNKMPYREDFDTSRPLSPYAASKKAAEAMCYTYHYLHGIDVTVFRYFTVYGPAGRPDMSPFRFTQWISEGRPVKIFGDGAQSRDFTYVQDIARGTIAGLKRVGFEVINLGTDRPVVLLDAIRMIEEALGKKATLEFYPAHKADVRSTWADIGKAAAILDWHPQYELRTGIKATVDWYMENRSWAKDVSTD